MKDTHSPERTYILADQLSHVVGGGSFFSTSPSLMSRISSFLGELISIHWVQLARRKKGAGACVGEQGGRGPVGSESLSPRSRIDTRGTIGHRMAVL